MTIEDLDSETKLSIENAIAMQTEVEAPVVTTKKPTAELGNNVKQLPNILANLKEDMADKSDHKSFCDMKCTANRQTRDLKKEESDGLIAESEKLPRTLSISPRM